MGTLNMLVPLLILMTTGGLKLTILFLQARSFLLDLRELGIFLLDINGLGSESHERGQDGLAPVKLSPSIVHLAQKRPADTRNGSAQHGDGVVVGNGVGRSGRARR